MLIFFGESAHRITIELNSKHGNARFPQKYYAIKYFFMEVRNEIRNWKKAFRKFSKIGRRRFQIFEYSNFWKKTNE